MDNTFEIKYVSIVNESVFNENIEQHISLSFDLSNWYQAQTGALMK